MCFGEHFIIERRGKGEKKRSRTHRAAVTGLAVILAVFEAITSLAASKWFPLQLFSLSPTIMVVCIVMMSTSFCLML